MTHGRGRPELHDRCEGHAAARIDLPTMAKEQPTASRGFLGRIKDLGTVFVFVAKRDKIFLPLVAGSVLLAIALGVLLFLAVGWLAIAMGVMLIVLGVLIPLSVRAMHARYVEVEANPGSAYSLVQDMRGDWRVTPALAPTTDYD